MRKVSDSFFVDLSDSWMNMKISWPISDLMEELRENILRDASIGTPQGWSTNLGDLLLILSKFIKLVRNYLLVVCLIDLSELILDGLNASSINYSLLNQFFRVDFKDVWSALDLFVHERLSEIGLVLFVMSISSIPYNINEDILMELLPVLNGYLHAFIQNVRLVSIHMNHWRIYCLCYLSAVV